MMCADSQEEADGWCCKIEEALGGEKCPDPTTDGVQPVNVEEVV